MMGPLSETDAKNQGRQSQGTRQVKVSHSVFVEPASIADPSLRENDGGEGFKAGSREHQDRPAFNNVTNVVQGSAHSGGSLRGVERTVASGPQSRTHAKGGVGPGLEGTKTPSLLSLGSSDGGIGEGGFVPGSPVSSSEAVWGGLERTLYSEGQRAVFGGFQAAVSDKPSELVSSAPFGEVAPADRARIARTVSGFHCETPAIKQTVGAERELLRTMRSIQLSGFLVDDVEEAGFLDARRPEAGLDASQTLSDTFQSPSDGVWTPSDSSECSLGPLDSIEMPLQAGGLLRSTTSVFEELRRNNSKQDAPLHNLGSSRLTEPFPFSTPSYTATTDHGAVLSPPPKLCLDRIRSLPKVTVLPITANFDTAASYSPHPPLLRRQLSEIPEDPASCPNSPKTHLHPGLQQQTSPLRRRHSLSDTPRPSNLLRRSFSEAPTFARELLRATSLSACQEPHEGPCFSSQMIDALVLSRAVYETKLADMLFYMELSRAELPCGSVEVVKHGNMEKVRDGKKVRRRLSAQPYVIVKSSHGHYLVACRGTDCFQDMIQDLQLVHKRFLGLGAAHWGFVQRAHSIDIQPMLDLLAAGEHIVLTGHSMGGAVAALLTLRVMEATHGEVRSQLQCITFGCPLFANGDLADHINTEYKELFVHILSKHDAVPRMVPLVAGLFNLAMGSTRGDHPLDALAAVDLAARFLRPSPLGPLVLGAKALLSGAGGLIPPRLRGVLKGLIRVAFPPFSAIYAAAGHMVVLDRDSKAFLPFYSELKSIKCQLGFALGMTNPGLLREHEISYYVTHVGQSTQPWLEKFGCVSAGVGTRPSAGVGIRPLNRVGSIEASVGIGSAGAHSPGMGFGMGLRTGSRIPGCELGLDLDCRVQMQRPKLKPSNSSLCLERLFDTEEELDGMVHAMSDFDALPVMTPSPRVKVVTPATRRKMRLRATCTVSFKCRGLVGLPSEDVSAKPRKKRGIMRCFGFLRHVGRITRVAKSVEDVCLAYTSVRLITLVVTHFM